MRVEHVHSTMLDVGVVRCRVCGHEWTTTPEQDELLATLLEHDATHDEPVGGELTHKGRLGE